MSCLNNVEVDKMCRTCRSFGGLKSLYDYYITDVCLAEMLTLCTPVKYFSEDELPKQICEDCVIELVRSYKFALKCKESNEIFREHLNNVNIPSFSNEITKDCDVNHVQISNCVNKDILNENIKKEIEFVQCTDNSSELCEQKYNLSTHDSLSTADNIKIEVKSEMIPIGTIKDAFAQHYLYNQNESTYESDQMTHLHESIDIDKVKIEDSECYKDKYQRCNESEETKYSSSEFETNDTIGVGNSDIESTNLKEKFIKYDFRQRNHLKQTANACELRDRYSDNGDQSCGSAGTDDATIPTNPSVQYPKWVNDGILQIISIDPDEVCKNNKQHKTLDVSSDGEEAANNATAASVISRDSKAKYDIAYEQFEKWCAETQVVDIDEKVLLDYFEGKKTLKASTLWTLYSMLRMELSLRKNIDIKKYTSLLAFLKRQQDGYHAKKSNVLSKENISKFLIEADDNTFLMAKVAMIIGIAGACRKAELTYLRVEDVVDEQSYFRVNISNPKTKREFAITMGNFDGIQFVEIIRKYINMRPPKVKHNRFFIKYSDGKCGVLPIGINTFGNLPKMIAQSIGLPNPVLFTGHCFRRSSVTLLADSGAALLKLKRKGFIENLIEKRKKIAIDILGDTHFVSQMTTTKTT